MALTTVGPYDFDPNDRIRARGAISPEVFEHEAGKPIGRKFHSRTVRRRSSGLRRIDRWR
jgi:hypothetical protein